MGREEEAWRTEGFDWETGDADLAVWVRNRGSGGSLSASALLAIALTAGMWRES